MLRSGISTVSRGVSTVLKSDLMSTSSHKSSHNVARPRLCEIYERIVNVLLTAGEVLMKTTRFPWMAISGEPLPEFPYACHIAHSQIGIRPSGSVSVS